ncbi:hypothetical protein LUZ61_010807 [Rhynchospora tenuis]|uniref:DNA repair protein RAD16 n=1 Tax=Rhynchospora tenuis TaxID=198213 RepID=A0AAD5ZZT4_9POAL|nr:hypothetical protein LUZ61_010807 [Rhynchospora tenuis]
MAPFNQQKRRRTGKAAIPSSSFSSQQNKPRLEWQVWSDELNEWLDRTQERGLHSSRNPRMVNPPTWEPSPNIVVPLMSHQKEWLYWALNQEGSDIKGGILADDMGMGKTIEAISLVLTSRDLSLRSGASSSTSPALKTTLVVCPTAALMQWAKEITKCTKTRTATVFLYHGAHREEHNADFRKYDFVLTTYRTLLNDYSNHIMPPKKKQRPAPDGMSLLHLVKWKRIILDEAHDVKNRQTVRAKAVCSLDSEYKWAISGTPLQNKLGDIYSLIRFLQVFPYSYYFCKNCDCRELDYGSLEDCTTCEHSKEDHFSWWNEHIADPILQKSNEVSSKRAMILLSKFVLQSVLLRRTKEDRASEVVLPQKHVIVRRDTLDERENNFYSALEAAIRSEYDSYVRAGTVKRNYSRIFILLLRLRQRAEIGNMMERDASAKGIVFSQFVDFLDLIEFSLSQSGIKTEKYTGDMLEEKRWKAIETFTIDANCKILLVSLMAGGVALNLTAASHVFLMDPWWNPAVDKQAQDRVHRIGQHKDVRVIRFIMKDTIEERILKLQEKKELLFQG